MAGFSGLIPVLSAMMLYVQQKSSDYLLFLQLKSAPLFRKVLTLGPPLPPPVTQYVTKHHINTKTVTAEQWTTVLSATTIYTTTPEPTAGAAYTATVSGQKIHEGIVTSLSPWQTYHFLVILLVLTLVPLCFLLATIYQDRQVWRLCDYNEHVRRETKEYRRRLKELKARYNPPNDRTFFELMYSRAYACLWRCSHKVDPYLQDLQDAVSVARDAALDKICATFLELLEYASKQSDRVSEKSTWLGKQASWLLFGLVFLVIIPAGSLIGKWVYVHIKNTSKWIGNWICAHVEDAVISLQHLGSDKDPAITTPVLERPREQAIANSEVKDETPHRHLSPSTSQQPNHFEVPYSDSPADKILLDSDEYDKLLQDSARLTSLLRKLESEKKDVKKEAKYCGRLRDQVDKRECPISQRETIAVKEARLAAAQRDQAMRAVRTLKASADRANVALKQERALSNAAKASTSRVQAELEKANAKNAELQAKLVDMQVAQEKATQPAPVAEAPANQPAPEVQGTELVSEAPEGEQSLAEPVDGSVPMGQDEVSDFAPGGFEETLNGDLVAATTRETAEPAMEIAGLPEEAGASHGSQEEDPDLMADDLVGIEAQAPAPSCAPPMQAEVQYEPLSPEMDSKSEDPSEPMEEVEEDCSSFDFTSWGKVLDEVAQSEASQPMEEVEGTGSSVGIGSNQPPFQLPQSHGTRVHQQQSSVQERLLIPGLFPSLIQGGNSGNGTGGSGCSASDAPRPVTRSEADGRNQVSSQEATPSSNWTTSLSFGQYTKRR